MIPTTRIGNFHRALKTNNTDNAAATVAAVSATLPTDILGTQGFRGAEIIPFGTGGNNKTGSGKLWLIDLIEPPESSNIESAKPAKLRIARAALTFDFTCGNLAGAASSVLLDTEFLADTIAAVTKTAFFTQLLSAYGVDVYTHSPADDTPALLILPDLGNRWAFYLDMFVAGGAVATAANALVNLST